MDSWAIKDIPEKDRKQFIINRLIKHNEELEEILEDDFGNKNCQEFYDIIDFNNEIIKYLSEG